MSKELVKTATDEQLAELEEGYAVEGNTAMYLPRIEMLSKDVMEGKGKNKKVATPAGTFQINRQTDEVGDDGKKVWEKVEIGEEMEGIIFFKRYQLRMYDEATEKYTSSPIYDRKDEEIPLFCDKKEVARGTPDELKAKYVVMNDKGKEVSNLKEERVVYVYYEGEAYQMNLRGSSMFSLLSYERAIGSPTSVVTHFSSEEKTAGSNTWNQMMFESVRKITAKEFEVIRELKESTLKAIKASKASFEKTDEQKAIDKDFDQVGSGK